MGNLAESKSPRVKHRLWATTLICVCTLLAFSSGSAEAGRGHGKRPLNGSVFLKKHSGIHQLIVNNGGEDDALVKMKKLSGDTVLSFYVRAGKRVKIDTVPEGDYKIEFASGSGYNRKKGCFLEYMKAMAFPVINSFVTTIRKNMVYKSSIECTLHQVHEGNVAAVRIANQAFMQD